MNEQATGATLAPQEQRTSMMVAHILGALFGIIGALIYWLLKKDNNEESFVQDQAKEVLNFELNILLIGIVAVILASITGIGVLSTLVGVLNLGLCIWGAIKANGGESFRYPVIIRLIK